MSKENMLFNSKEFLTIQQLSRFSLQSVIAFNDYLIILKSDFNTLPTSVNLSDGHVGLIHLPVANRSLAKL